MLSRAQRSASASASFRSMPMDSAPRKIEHQLLGEAGRHFRLVLIDDVALVIGLDAAAGAGDDVGGIDQLVLLVLG